MTSNASSNVPDFLGMVPADAPISASDTELGQILLDDAVTTFYPDIIAWRDSKQEQIAVRSARGVHIIAQLPTGFGKTMASIIPAICQGGCTVFICPTLALIADLCSDCKEREIPALEFTGSSDHLVQEYAVRFCSQMHGGIVFCTPEKACSNQAQDLFDKVPITRIVLDECHTADQWLHLRPAMGDDILGAWLKKWIQRGAAVTFQSATIAQSVYGRLQALSGLRLDQFDLILASVSRLNLVCNAKTKPGRVAALIEHCMSEMTKDGREQCLNGIIFARTSGRCERIATELNSALISSEIPGKCAAFYGSKRPADLNNLLASWKNGTINVLVATETLSMGISHSNLHFVIDAGLPDSPTAYVQHIGRPARGPNQTGRCLLLANPSTDFSEWAALHSLPKRESRMTPSSGGTSSLPTNFEYQWHGSTTESAAEWARLEFVDQDTPEMHRKYFDLSEMVLLFFKATHGACLMRQSSELFRHQSLPNSESNCDQCECCMHRVNATQPSTWARFGGAGLDVSLLAELFIAAIKCFDTRGIEWKTATDVIRWGISKAKSELPQSSDASKKTASSLEKNLSRKVTEWIQGADQNLSELDLKEEAIVLCSTITESITKVLRNCQIRNLRSVGEDTFFIIACALVVEKKVLMWRAEKSGREFYAKMLLVFTGDQDTCIEGLTLRSEVSN